MNLAFRLDSSHLIGAGHVNRCLKLADELKHKCNKIIFITKNLKGNFNKQIKKKNFKNIIIKKSNIKKDTAHDLNETKKICKKNLINILVKDHYHLTKNWEKKIKKNINKLVVIDDFSKEKHYSDIIFNNLNKNTIKGTKVFTGLEFVIIPNKLRKKLEGKKNKKKIIGTFFGSSDNLNCTQAFLNIFSQKDFIKFKFISILGINNKKNKIIKKKFKKNKNIKIIENYKKMSNFFDKIDILISSGGVTSYEALYSNKKCINVPINFHQKTNSNFQEKMKISSILNYVNITKKNKNFLLNYFIKNFKKNELNENKLYLDGNGSKRISEIIIPSKFKDTFLAKAKNLNDCIDLFKLYNEKEAIKNSISKKKVSFNNHLNWFKKKLLSKKSIIYILKIDNLCAGQVRFDLIEKNKAIIDYSIDKIFRERGWGKLMLSEAIKKVHKEKGIKYFKAIVKKRNFKSTKVFENLHFFKQNKKKYIEFNRHFLNT